MAVSGRVKAAEGLTRSKIKRIIISIPINDHVHPSTVSYSSWVHPYGFLDIPVVSVSNMASMNSPKTADSALDWLCGSVCTGGWFLAPQLLVQLLADGIVFADLPLTGQVCAHVWC